MHRTWTGVAALTVLCLTLCAAGAAAQMVTGLYYQEVEKDGRVYVFNTPERFKAWSASGEVGTSITLVGRAERGMTLVAENETAADLYLFKHNLPGYERPTPPPPKTVDDRLFYRDGRTNFVMKTGTVGISNRVQARYTKVDPDGGPQLVDRNGGFRIRRMKTTIEGNITDWRFKLQANWVGGVTLSAASLAGGSLSTTVEQRPILEDAEVWWAKHPMATVWLGQGKAYFGRQELTSSGRQQFVDRTLVSNRFDPARQIGIGLIGVNSRKTFEYNFGIYNGDGRDRINRVQNANDEFMKVGRVVWTPFGEYRLEESSLDYPTTPKLALGVAMLEDTEGTVVGAGDVTRVGFEAAFKLRGLNAVAEYKQEERDTTPTLTVDTDGYYAQLGYLFPNKKFEIAGRFGSIDSDTASADQEETGFALNWYFDRHNQKIQADYRNIDFGLPSLIDSNEIRIQYQLIF